MGGRHRLERQAKKTGESQGKIIRDELARARKVLAHVNHSIVTVDRSNKMPEPLPSE